jgi:ABC-2 type transport system permease protein
MTDSAVASVSSDRPTRPTQPRRNLGAGFWPSTFAVAGRTIRKFMRTPQLIVFTTIQSAVFLLIFRYVFGGAIQTGQEYVLFFAPGFITTAVLFAGMGAAVGVAEDQEHGFIDRLRSLPIPRAAVLVGRSLADTALVVWALMVATLFGFAVGFRLGGSVAEALAAFGLCILFGFAFEWIFIVMGLVAGNAQAAQGLTFLVFPLVFVSSAYVPVESLPAGLEAFGDYQPITAMVNGVRGLAGGAEAEALLAHSTNYYIGVSLLWTAGLVALFGLLSVMRFSAKS